MTVIIDDPHVIEAITALVTIVTPLLIAIIKK